MGLADKAAEPGDLHQLPDEQLIRRFCGDPPDRGAGEELFGRCLTKIQSFIHTWAAKRMHHLPRTCDREAFVQDAAGRARDKLVRKVHTFKFKGSFDGWLRRLSVRAAVEEYLLLIGRGPQPREFVPLEEDFRSKHWPSPFERVRALERHEIFRNLLAEHAKTSNRNRKSATAVSLCTWEECTAREVAERLDTTKDYVWQLISHDYNELRTLFAQKLGVTSTKQI